MLFRGPSTEKCLLGDKKDHITQNPQQVDFRLHVDNGDVKKHHDLAQERRQRSESAKQGIL